MPDNFLIDRSKLRSSIFGPPQIQAKYVEIMRDAIDTDAVGRVMTPGYPQYGKIPTAPGAPPLPTPYLLAWSSADSTDLIVTEDGNNYILVYE